MFYKMIENKCNEWYSSENKSLRLNIRNICGDETVWEV